MEVLDKEAVTLNSLAKLLRLQLSSGQLSSDPNDWSESSLGSAAAAGLQQGESQPSDGHHLFGGGRPRHRATAARAQRWQPALGGGRAQPGALLQRGASAWPALEGSQPLRSAMPRGQPGGDGWRQYSGAPSQQAARAELALQDGPNSGFAFSADEPSGVARPSSFGAAGQLSGGSWVSSPSAAPDPGTAVEWVDTIEPDSGHAIAKDAYTQQEYLRPTGRVDAGSSEAVPEYGFTAPGDSLNTGADSPLVADTLVEPDDDFMEDARPLGGTAGATREFVPSSLLAEPTTRSRRRAGRQGAPRFRQLTSDEERMQSLLDKGSYAGF